MKIDAEEYYLAHYGILRRSGRYPYGSGGPENASNKGFHDYVEILRGKGMSETEIAKGMGVTTTQLRAALSIVKNEERQAKISTAQALKDKGYSPSAIGRKMGINESSVRSLLAPGSAAKTNVLQSTVAMLKKEVGEKGYIDVGSGVENHLGISQTKLSTAVAALKEEGYGIHYVKVQQLGTGKQTTIKVLAAPDTTYSEVYRNRDQIKQITEYSVDGGLNFDGFQQPLSISSKRVSVRYAEDGGANADGVIYVRPGVDDISLGGARYAQVRILVDGNRYLKGMAMYKDDLPDGVDLEFNTNKTKADVGSNKLDAMKKISADPENPFTSSIRRQLKEYNPDGSFKRVTSVMNIVNEEGTWDSWSKSLSSQMLSKQSPLLAKTQLNMTYEAQKQKLDDILALTNPVIKKKLLQTYADETDSSAIHLKAAALPRQRNSVILPFNSVKETEIYAPNFRNGERVVLIRHPHGGIFEIPELTVNNRSPEAKKVLGNTPDAVGINSEVAKRLSGADFDGDTVLVIPNSSGRIKTAPALEGLKNFDPQKAYPGYEGMPKMSPETKQTEMGKVSNLITDMTIKGANPQELAAAVRHSMVVIDAEKHGLNYKLSAEKNGIAHLKQKYQGSSRAGASTLVSRSTSKVRIDERRIARVKEGGPIDKKTGKKVYVNTDRKLVNKEGVESKAKDIVTQMSITDDARKLSSGTPIEKIYADHANKLKSLANTARLEMINTKSIPVSQSAKKTYASEVKSLEAKLNLAIRNRPLERQAQLIANTAVNAKRQANPHMESDELKTLKFKELTKARARTNAKKQLIEITESEWNAIQAGAVSSHKLSQILNNTDLTRVKQLATPKTQLLMTSAKTARAEQMISSGYTQAEVADALGVSLTTLKKSIGGE